MINFNNVLGPAAGDVALYGGILGAVLMLAAFFRDVHIRGWKQLDQPSAALKLIAFLVALLVAYVGHVGSAERRSHDEASDSEIATLQTAIGTLQTGGTVHDQKLRICRPPFARHRVD